MRPLRWWNNEIPQCANCSTRRHPRSWKRLCVRCYPLVAKIDKIDRGHYQRKARCAGTRKVDNKSLRLCAVVELENLKMLEAPLLGETDGKDIENLLVTLSEAARSDTDQIDGARYYFNDCVDSGQRARIYEILLRIVESLPSKAARRPAARWPFWITMPLGNQSLLENG